MRYFCIVLKSQSREILLNIRKCCMQVFMKDIKPLNRMGRFSF